MLGRARIGPVAMMLMVALIVLAVVAGATLIYWSAVLYHVLRTMVRIPTARRGLRLESSDGAGTARVCAIVPAHNEEACIASVAATLAAQDFPALACVFVLDRCTDQTRAVLERAWAGASPAPGRDRPELEIIELAECPPGWVGKSHAVWTGATRSALAARADVLLFVDADTTLHPGVVRACAALMRERSVQMLSLLSTLTHHHWFEKLVQPAATMELLRQYPIVRANSRDRPRAFANGQFIMIASSAYRTIGGHEAIRESVLEDVELARRCAWFKVPAALLLADGLLHCRMYDRYDAFARGWQRIFGESANRKPARLRKIARRVRLVGTVLPGLSLAAAVVGIAAGAGQGAPAAAVVCAALGAGAVGVYAVVLLVTYALGRSPIWAAPGFPIGCWMVGGIMNRAARDLDAGRPTVWGGREYVRDTR